MEGWDPSGCGGQTDRIASPLRLSKWVEFSLSIQDVYELKHFDEYVIHYQNGLNPNFGTANTDRSFGSE